MKKRFRQQIETWKGEQVCQCSPVFGGDLGQSFDIEFAGGLRCFVKHYSEMGKAITEAEQLQALHAQQQIKIPQVYFFNEDLLVLEWIESSPQKDAAFFMKFGGQLAQMHRAPCPTPLSVSWETYYLEHKVGNLIQEIQDPTLDRFFSLLPAQVSPLFEMIQEPLSLIHGDLWSGNFMCDSGRNPVLIDPASYCGHREVDLAMTKLFGGFDREFYQAYHESYPLQEGYEERENLYLLYPVLLHVKLFGGSYYDQALSLFKAYL